MGKLFGVFGSHGWTQRHTLQGTGAGVTGIAVDMDIIPPATLQLLGPRLALCIASSANWIFLVNMLPFANVDALFGKYFRCAGLPLQDRQAKHALALQKFRATRDGIAGAQEVKFQPMAGKDGYVGGGVIHGESRYRIHLNTATFLQRSATYCTEVYLHEATHKYARTDDHAYLTPNYVDDPQPYLTEISMAQALNNADSYTGFAKEVTLRFNQAANANAAAAAPAGPNGAVV